MLYFMRETWFPVTQENKKYLENDFHILQMENSEFEPDLLIKNDLWDFDYMY